MKTECNNQYIKAQCVMLLQSLETFESGIEIAATQDDGKTSKEEARVINDITKSIEKLKKTLNKYV